ncbi:Protein flp [Penicillium sp. IBT 35674x]|nr:Protein flp [Penicillium sp. IBT 35674x]
MWKTFTTILATQTILQANKESSPLSRLQNLKTTLEQIRQISGTAGVSIGVLHHGQELYKENLGYCDVAAKEAADSQTLYGLGSLTKSMTAFAIGNLINDGLLTWGTPVKEILPDFQHKSPSVTNLTTVVDLLAHRTGLSSDISFTFQGDGEALLPAEQMIPTFNNMDQVESFRGKWSYNSWGYAIAGRIIEKLSNCSFHEYLKTNIYDKLGMENTTTRILSHHSGNIAKPYATDSNANSIHLQSPMIFEDTLFEAAAGAYSNVDDLLTYSASILTAYRDGGDSDLKELETLLSSQIPVLGPSFHERSYAMGWIRTELPGRLGVMGENIAILDDVDELPEIGQGSPSMLCIYHQGSTVGYYTNIALFPETQSAIVVLANSIPLTDSPDTIMQALSQALFDFPNPVDLVSFTEDTSNKLIHKYKQQAENITSRRRIGTRRFSLGEYAGSYINELKNFVLEIQIGPENNTLEVLFQGSEFQRYSLRHLEDNIFEWSLSLDEEAERGRYHITEVDYFLIDFRTVMKSSSMAVSENRSIAIVGVGPSMSRSLALWLASLGWNIALISRSEETLSKIATEIKNAQKNPDAKVVYKTGDTSDPSSLKTALDWSVEQFQCKLDVLNYNAAHVCETSIMDLHPEALESDFKVSAVGTLVAGQWFAQNARIDRVAQGEYPVFLVTGGLLDKNPVPFFSSLSISKSASQNVSRLFAQWLPERYSILVGMPLVRGTVTGSATGKFEGGVHPDDIIQKFSAFTGEDIDCLEE